MSNENPLEKIVSEVQGKVSRQIDSDDATRVESANQRKRHASGDELSKRRQEKQVGTRSKTAETSSPRPRRPRIAKPERDTQVKSITKRIPLEAAALLKQASGYQRGDGVWPDTEDGIVYAALMNWFHDNGYPRKKNGT